MTKTPPNPFPLADSPLLLPDDVQNESDHVQESTSAESLPDAMSEAALTTNPNDESTPPVSQHEKSPMDDSPSQSDSAENINPFSNPVPREAPADAKTLSPGYLASRSRILTIDAKDTVETEEDREQTIWHELRNSNLTHRILTGTLDAVAPNIHGELMGFVHYKGFPVQIPIKSLLFNGTRMPNGRRVQTVDELKRIASARMNSEIDFIVSDMKSDPLDIRASRKAAMLKKRQTFYLEPDEFGDPLIYPGRVVQARVVAVADLSIYVEVFGVECAIRGPELAWEWIGNVREHFSVGDRVLVRVTSIEGSTINDLKITADVRSVSDTTMQDKMAQCVPQAKYAGRVTDVRHGVIYVRLNIGVNAIAHSCFDRRLPGKNDDVSFHVTRINEDEGVAVGIITRIIKQNL